MVQGKNLNPATDFQRKLVRKRIVGKLLNKLIWISLFLVGLLFYFYLFGMSNGINIVYFVVILLIVVSLFVVYSWLTIHRYQQSKKYFSFTQMGDVEELRQALKIIEEEKNPDLWHRKFSGLWLLGLFTLIGSGAYFFIGIFNQQQSEFSAQQAALTSISVVASPTPVNCNGRFPYKPAESCTLIIKTPDGGHGSGFSTEKGFVVTNWHVIRDASTFFTSIRGVDYELRYWGHSVEDDLAVLKLPEGVNVGICHWFDSGKLQKGDKVGLIGWGGLIDYGEAAMAEGIYSRMVNLGDVNDRIQTDVSVNLGNSGGPLFNGCGVVGVVESKFVWLDANTPIEGMGFAIPSSVAQVKVKALIQESNGQRPPTPTPITIKRTTCAYLLSQDSSLGIVKILDDYIVCIDKRMKYWDTISRDKLSIQANQVLDNLMNTYRLQFDLCFRLQNLYIDNAHEATNDEIIMATTIHTWSDQIESLELSLSR